MRMTTLIPMRQGRLFMGNKHVVYILQCGDDTLYTGYTNDLAHRLQMHREGKGAKYTRGRGPLQLVYEESYTNKSDALAREYEIKQYRRVKKCELINQQRLKKGQIFNEDKEKL